MLKRLRARFICSIMAIVTLMLCAIVVTVVHYTHVNLQVENQHIMESIASDPRQLGSGNGSQERTLPFFALQINSITREVLTINGGYFDLSDRAVLEDLIEQTYFSEEDQGELEEYNLRFFKKNSWISTCIVFFDLTGEERTVARTKRACIFVAAISFLIFLGLSFLLARWMVQPVEKAWTQQNQFVSDASHELKTPLTVILTNAELLQAPDYDEQTKGQFSTNILTMANQMRGLVEGLLDLARVDNGMPKAVWERVDLSQLIEDAVLPFEPLFFEKELELDSFIDPGIIVNGSAEHLRRVLEILLDNARKYSAAPAVVQVLLQKQGKNQCTLCVKNPGPPISPEDQKNIFKRFYRADAARSRDGSYGLGLPIAEGIVERHGGRIWATSTGGVNAFFVTLPTV